jgi:hypothetical protein
MVVRIVEHGSPRTAVSVSAESGALDGENRQVDTDDGPFKLGRPWKSMYLKLVWFLKFS